MSEKKSTTGKKKHMRLCSECGSENVIIICPVVTCKKFFCQQCAEIEAPGSDLATWICKTCKRFELSTRKKPDPAEKREVFMTPRQLNYTGAIRKSEPVPNDLTKNKDDENERLKAELDEMKKQMQLMKNALARNVNKGDSNILDQSHQQFEHKELNPDCDPYIPERIDSASTSSESKNFDAAADIAKYLADAIRLLQPNVTVGAAHPGFDPDEQLKLTMIRASLPDLPTFSGALQEWPLFEKIYRTTTETGKFTEDLNHLRLMKSLEGEAKVECQRLLNGMAGGSAIMNHLKSVYGDPEKILQRQVKKLLNMKAPRDLEKYQLKDFVNELESLVINAENLQRSDFLSQPSITDQLVLKLRDRHRDAWGAMKLANPNVNLKDLWKYLSERLKDASAQPPTESYHYRNKESRRVNAHREYRDECLKCHSDSHELQHCSDFKRLMLTDKKKLVRNKGLCNCCLKQGHRWKDCKSKRMCNIDGCKEFHHRVLHVKSSFIGTNIDADKELRRQKGDKRAGMSSSQQTRVDNEVINFHKSSAVMYKILPVLLHGNNGESVETYAFLDDGSSVTLLDREIYDKLNLEGKPKPLNLRWTSGICREESDSYMVDCQISKGRKGKKFPLYGVRTVDQLDLATQTVIASELQQRFKHLRGVPIPEFKDARPKLLIGLKNVSF